MAYPLPRFSRRAMVVTSKERAISTVASVEPSLTTMISSISRLRVSTVRTSAIVFSSLYAAMIAEIPKRFTSTTYQGAVCNRQTITHPHRAFSGQLFAKGTKHETHIHLRIATDFVERLQLAGEPPHHQSDLLPSRRQPAREPRHPAVDGFRFHGRRR